MIKNMLGLLVVALSLLIPPPALAAPGEDEQSPRYPDIKIFTEFFPPFNFEENGRMKGISVELLAAVFKEMKLADPTSKVVQAPWSRGYAEAQIRPNLLLFSTVRTPGREKKFKWAGPILDSDIVLIARKEDNIRFHPENRPYSQTFAVSHQDVVELELLRLGIPHSKIYHWNALKTAPLMLVRGRVDMWGYDRVAASYTLTRLGFNPRDFKVVHELLRNPYYFAFSKGTDDRFVADFQEALTRLNKAGQTKRIIGRYLSETVSGLKAAE